MTSKYLLGYAVNNSWCDPRRDKQYNIKAHRVTPNDVSKGSVGAINYFSNLSTRINLPVTGIRYHVFSVDSVPLDMLNLLNGEYDQNGTLLKYGYWVRGKWIKFSSSMVSNKVMVDIYAAGGEHIPTSYSYYLLTEEGSMLFCVEQDSNLAVDYNNDYIFLRVYSNTYYRAGNTLGADDVLYVKHYKNISGFIPNNGVSEIYDMQTVYNMYAAKSGKVLAWVNGYRVPALSMSTMKSGDTVEMVYDGSIESIRTFTLGDLLGFNSTRDNEGKLILHNDDTSIDKIRFVDDCDIYVESDVVVYQNNSYYTRRFGYYLDAYRRQNKRQLTHQDYSVSVLGINAVADNLKADLESDYPSLDGTNSQVLNKNNFKITVTYRKDGISQPVVNNACRLHDLYKLPSADILKAMHGVTATVDIWKAHNLENSAYIRHLDMYYEQLSTSVLREAFGYNAISKIVGDTPSSVVTTSGVYIDLAPQLRQNSTAYEYDIDGVLIGSYPHVSGSVYNVQAANNAITKTVEVLSGVGTNQPDIKFGSSNVAITTGWNYRVYVCPKIGGIPNDAWADITNTNNYTVTNNLVNYTGSIPNAYIAVVSDSKFLQLEFDLDSDNGVFTFELAQLEDRGYGYTTKSLTIPYGQMDIIVNGRSLIKDLEYTVDFPRVYIYNSKYLLQPAYTTTQQVLVRCYGFCNSDLSSDLDEDYGFIKHGYLSDNDKFDIRDDKVLRITVDGKLKTMDSVQFSEEHTGVSIMHADNGLPYQVKDIVVPMIGYVDTDTYSLRQASILVDTQTSNFLSSYLPPYDRGDVMVIAQKHKLHSPYFSRVILDMVNDVITESMCVTYVTDQQILDALSGYDPLFSIDPLYLFDDNLYTYVQVDPHAQSTMMTVGAQQYRVLTRLIALYGRSKLILNDHVTITV